MSTDADKFDEHFKKVLHNGDLDGRFFLESFDPSDREGMALILERLQDFGSSLGHGWFGWIRPFRVHTNYVNEAYSNAYATQCPTDEQLYFVGITAGIALKGFALWSTILACTAVCDDGQRQRQPRPLLDIFTAFRARTMMEAWHVLPRDRDRVALAHYMHLAALEYLFFHEIAHIIHGHVGRRRFRGRTLESSGELQISPDQSISFEDHLMEVDADQAAVWWCLDNWSRRRAPLLAEGGFKLEVDDYAYLLFFTVCILQHAFGAMSTKVEEISLLPGSSHPHGEVRIDVAYDAIHKYYEHGGVIEAYNSDNLSWVLWRAIEDARDAITLLAPEHTPFPNLFRTGKLGKPIKEVHQLYHRHLAEETRSAWRPFRLNVEPIKDATEKLARALEADVTSLQIELGHQLRGMAAAPASLEELRQLAQRWMADKRQLLAAAVCTSARVSDFLEMPEQRRNRLMLGLAVLDIVSGLITGVSPVVVTALIIREGLVALCDKTPPPDNE